MYFDLKLRLKQLFSYTFYAILKGVRIIVFKFTISHFVDAHASHASAHGRPWSCGHIGEGGGAI